MGRRSVVAEVSGRRRDQERLPVGYWVSFGGGENILELGSGDGCTALPLNCRL